MVELVPPKEEINKNEECFVKNYAGNIYFNFNYQYI